MTSMNDFNTQVTKEFRANAGKVGGPLRGAPMLLLHSIGAKSGEERLHPLMYQGLGGDFAIFASYAGGPKNPAWFHNLVANADASIEVGASTVPVTARVALAGERETIWTVQKERYPQFAEYEAKTDREIAVVILDRRG